MFAKSHIPTTCIKIPIRLNTQAYVDEWTTKGGTVTQAATGFSIDRPLIRLTVSLVETVALAKMGIAAGHGVIGSVCTVLSPTRRRMPCLNDRSTTSELSPNRYRLDDATMKSGLRYVTLEDRFKLIRDFVSWIPSLTS